MPVSALLPVAEDLDRGLPRQARQWLPQVEAAATPQWGKAMSPQRHLLRLLPLKQPSLAFMPPNQAVPVLEMAQGPAPPAGFSLQARSFLRPARPLLAPKGIMRSSGDPALAGSGRRPPAFLGSGHHATRAGPDSTRRDPAPRRQQRFRAGLPATFPPRPGRTGVCSGVSSRTRRAPVLQSKLPGMSSCFVPVLSTVPVLGGTL